MFPIVQFLNHCFYFVCINDISSNILTNVKLFTDDTSLFSIVNDTNDCFENLSNDLCIISHSAYQWKMSFNPDGPKKAQEAIFSRKTSIQSHPILFFDNNHLIKTTHQKHVVLSLDETLGENK